VANRETANESAVPPAIIVFEAVFLILKLQMHVVSYLDVANAGLFQSSSSQRART
jgi:hypothetical protein